MISICVTVYNSADTIDSFMKPILDFMEHEDSEIIFTDNLSDDGTGDKILQFRKILGERLVFKQARCNRGEGRNLAINLSKGDYIMNLDSDIYYEELNQMLITAHNIGPNDIVCIRGAFPGTIATFGPADFYRGVANYPPFNYAEDRYIWKIAKNMGRLKEITSSEDWMKPIERNIDPNLNNGEKRYSQSKRELWKRRIENISCIIFVEKCGFRFYRKNFTDGSLKTLPYAIFLYTTGYIKSKRIMVEPADQAAKIAKPKNKET